MANTEIRRTTGSTPTNAEKFTVSLWFKLSQVGSSVGLFGWRENSNSGNNNLFIRINGNGNFQIYFTSNNGNDNHLTLLTNRVFRDCNSWYHAVISVDSSQSTSSDRAKLYINGIQETSFSSASYPASGRTFFSNDTQINFGKTRSTGDADTYFSGIQSHIHFTDGYAYDATPFGETDSTTGEWKIKTSVTGVTYGNNGFWWLKDSIATTDHSPNSNSWSSGGGTLTKTEDCPSNVFATLNAVHRIHDYTLTEGNNTFTNSSTGHRSANSTLAANTGKWYAEVKVIAQDGSATYPQIGIIDVDKFSIYSYTGSSNKGYAYLSNGNKQYNGSATSFGNTYTVGDIVGIAMDLDNSKIYFSKNGTWENSGVPTSGSTGTGSAYDIASDVFYSFTGSSYDGSQNPVYSWNFGNGYFGTTAVSSAGTNASGIGIFEYDVPTGFTALSTKGLNL